MSALADVVPLLRCPRCGDALTLEARTVRCPAGHATDVARAGHVNFLSRPPGAAADDAAMVAARDEVLASGLYAPIERALVEAVAHLDLPPGCVVDVGAGTGSYTARVLDALPGRPGVALDLSAHAARRAARAHPRLASLVVDARDGLPVRTGAAAVVLDVFAPRNAPEFARVLAHGGVVVVVTPDPAHLGELVDELGLPGVDPRKADRLATQFADFAAGDRRVVRDRVQIDGRTAALVARMGPGAHHADPGDLDRLAADPTGREITLAVDVHTYRLS